MALEYFHYTELPVYRNGQIAVFKECPGVYLFYYFGHADIRHRRIMALRCSLKSAIHRADQLRGQLNRGVLKRKYRLDF